ncbi:MAG: hypothetical protein ACO3YZ_03820 [Candidatus Nanopelagicaceae bacterium]
MDFYTSSDIRTDLPITRYRGEITELTKLPNGAIAFTEELPLGNKKPRTIPEGAVFIGTLQEAAKFHQPDDIVAVTTLHHFIHPDIPSHIEPEPEEPEKINTSLNILGRFA